MIDVRKRGAGDFRLRFGSDTRGTRADTVKFLGVRSTRKIALIQETCISLELDWNEQANGSYLSAAVILSPAASSSNPLAGSDWIKIEYSALLSPNSGVNKKPMDCSVFCTAPQRSK